MGPEPIEAKVIRSEVAPTPWRGPEKTKWKRFWPHGSLREQIARCESSEELEALRAKIVAAANRREISRGTLRKLEKAGSARAAELATRLIVAPPRRIIIP